VPSSVCPHTKFKTCWYKTDDIRYADFTGHSAANLCKMCGMNNFKIANAQQAKMDCKYKNTKEK
jgi:hypothetical protein